MSENIGRYNVIFEILTKQQGDIEKIRKEATGLQGAFNTAKGAFAGIVAANVVQGAINSIGGIIGTAKNLAAQAETSAQSFKTLLGNATAAKKLLAELNEFSIETPFEPAEIEASAKTLLGFGRTAKEVKSDIELIGNASAATGTDLQSLALVFGQVAGVGKLGGQDALQFINQGIPIYQLLSESLGKSVSEVKKLQEQGRITFNDLRDSFAKASEQGGKFAGALADQSKTYSGLISTFRGNVDEFLKSIGQAILPAIKPIVAAFAEIFATLTKRFNELKPQIEEAFQIIGEVAKPVFSFLLGAVASLASGFITFIKVLAGVPKFIKDNETSLKLLAVAIVSFNIPLLISTTLMLKNTIASKAKAVADLFLAQKTGILTRAQWLLNAAFAANPIGVIVAAVAALAAGMVYLYRNSETVRNIFAGIANVANDLIGVFTGLSAKVSDLFSNGLGDGLKKIGLGIIENIRNSFKEAFTDLENIVSGEDVGKSALRLAEKVLNIMTFGLSGQIKKAASFILDSFNEGFDENKELEAKVRVRLNRGSLGGSGAFADQLDQLRRDRELREKQAAEKKEADRKAAQEAAKEAEKRAKIALDKEIEATKLKFALEEKEARETIQNADELAKKLEEIEIRKSIAIANVNRKYVKEGGLVFIELGNQIDELNRKYNALFKREKVDILDILSPKDLGIVKTQVEILNDELSKLKISFNNVTDPKIKEQIKEQIESIKKDIESFQSPKLNNLTFISGGFDAVPLEDILPNDRVQVLRDRLVNIGNSVGNFKERLQEGLVSDPLELKGFDKLMDEGDQIIALFKRLGIELPKETAKIQDATGNVLGVTPEQLRLAGDAIDIVSSGFSQATDIIRAELDKRIGIQEDRVKKAEEVAEKGNVRQLEIEEARLAELQSKRENAVKKQEILEKAAAQAQILLNTAMTISNIQLGVSKTFGASGPAAPITVPIVLAIVGGLIASAANLFKPPTFIEGTEEVGSDPRFMKFKKHHRQDGYTASFDGKERIVDPLTNKELKGFPNKLLPKAVNAYLNPKIRKELLPVAGYHKSDNTDLLKGIEGLRSDVQNLKISTKLDKKGFVQEIQRQVQEVMRREKYKA